MINTNMYIEALLHPAGGHRGSHKAHQADNQKWEIFILNHRLKRWFNVKISHCRMFIDIWQRDQNHPNHCDKTTIMVCYWNKVGRLWIETSGPRWLMHSENVY